MRKGNRILKTCNGVLSVPALLLAIGISGCESGGSGGQGASTPVVESVSVESVRFIDTVESSTQTSTSDCGYSARLKGKSVWLFGDTILSVPNENNQQVLCNSWSYTYDVDAGDGIAGFGEAVDAVGAPTPLIPLNAEELEYNSVHGLENCVEEPCGVRWAIWPGVIIPHPDESVAYVFYHKFHVGTGVLNFTHVGHSIAVWENFDQPAQRPEFNLFEDYPTLFFSSTDTLLGDGFGSAAVNSDGFFYIFGCEFTETSNTSPCLLARVPVDSILEREAWRFLDADGSWSPDHGQAVPVFNGSNMMTVFYNEYLGRYVAVYSRPMSLDVEMRTSPAPWGPWSKEIRLFSAHMPTGEIDWVYDALAHPEFSTDNGRTIYVTYSRQIAVLRSELRLVEVRLGLVH